MSNVLVTENLFNGLETSASVNLSNVLNSIISDNVMNNDNSIALFGTSNVLITGNVTTNATGVIPGDPSNIASAVFLDGATNTTITNNIISGASHNGISMLNGTNGVMIMNNNITTSVSSGINIGGTQNSNITIVSNNITGNTTGLFVKPGSYTQTMDILNVSGNYWNSASGPNFNGMGPGTGDTINDQNIPGGTQTVIFEPFAVEPLPDPSPFTLNQTSSMNVDVGFDISFSITFVIPVSSVNFEILTFVDKLPILTSTWIISSNPQSIFTIVDGSLVINGLPKAFASGTYMVMITAKTNDQDSGQTYINNISQSIQIGGSSGIIQTFNVSSTASVGTIVTPSPTPMFDPTPWIITGVALFVCLLFGTLYFMKSNNTKSNNETIVTIVTNAS
jgi:Right handed beta helix region